MKNPFRTAIAIGAYAPVPSGYPDSPSIFVHDNEVYLDDANYPDVTGPGPLRGNVGDIIDSATQPQYAGTNESITIVDQPGIFMDYTSISPHDQSVPQDVGSIPGSVQLTIHNGPVSGFQMDNYTQGSRVPLKSQPPGTYGPVGITEPDYATRAAYANFQQAFADVSTEASYQSQIAAI